MGSQKSTESNIDQSSFEIDIRNQSNIFSELE